MLNKFWHYVKTCSCYEKYFTCFIIKESNHSGLYADFLCACLGPQADILPFLVCSVIFRYIFDHMQFIQPCPKRLIYLAYHIYIAPIKILTGNIIGKIEKINFRTLYRIVYQIRKWSIWFDKMWECNQKLSSIFHSTNDDFEDAFLLQKHSFVQLIR